jgi:hypothetical protein
LAEPEKTSTHTKRRRILFLGALALLLIFGAFKTARVLGLVRSLMTHLDQLEAFTAAETNPSLRQMDETLRGAHADLQALRGEIAWVLPITRRLGWLPGVGGDLQAAPALLDTALHVTEAGVLALDSLEPVIAMTERENSTEAPLVVVLETFSDARPALEAAQNELILAAHHRAAIDDATLSRRTASLLDRLDRYLPLMQIAFDGALVLPELLGATEQRTYLVLAQNNDEMRATGGFISAVGILTLNHGEIGDIVFQDSYLVDDFSRPYPDSPPPFLRYMGIDQWVFRDANWSPDWPTAAQKAIELYRGEPDPQVDGLIAVDQHALQIIVAALAPLEIADWPEPVTGENVISLVRMSWSPTEVENWQGFDLDWWKRRKRFMGDLVGAMRAKIERTPDQVSWVALARAVLRTLDERHVQIWLADSTSPAAALLAERGWDGAIRQVAGDYLMVVDANLGFNKANAAVRPSLDYRVLVSADGTAQATLSVRHTHTGAPADDCNHEPRYGDDYEDLINRCYWDYLRVYAPGGSQLLAATSHPVPAKWLLTGQAQAGTAQTLPDEKGKSVFASFFVLPRGGELETRLVYQLPPGALDQTSQLGYYRLLVQKQAGVADLPLRVTLTLPPGAIIQAVEASGLSSSADKIQQTEPYVVTFDTTLNTDQTIQVWFDTGGSHE